MGRHLLHCLPVIACAFPAFAAGPVDVGRMVTQEFTAVRRVFTGGRPGVPRVVARPGASCSLVAPKLGPAETCTVDGFCPVVSVAQQVALAGERSGGLDELLRFTGMENFYDDDLRPMDLDGWIFGKTTDGFFWAFEAPRASPDQVVEVLSRYAVYPTDGGVMLPGLTVYVNGVLTDPIRHAETLQEMANITRQPTIGIYVGTAPFPRDFVKAGREKWATFQRWFVEVEDRRLLVPLRTSKAIASVQNLATWGARNGRAVTWLAHSRGALVLSLGLTGATTQAARDGTSLSAQYVRSLGGAAPFWPDGKHAPADNRHFVHILDFTPRFNAHNAVLPELGSRPRFGNDGQQVFFEGLGTAEDPLRGADPALVDWMRVHFTRYHDVLMYLEQYKADRAPLMRELLERKSVPLDASRSVR